MKKNFVRVMLFGALALAVSTTVTSCKDYDDDIKGLQEQVDNIKSTNPVSTEDMKAAVEKAQEELQEKLDLLTSQLNDKAAASKLEEEIENLKQALEDAVGEDASNLAGKLVEAQNDLNILKQAMADEGLVGKLKKDVDDLKAMQTTLSALISAEKQYIASGDVSGFKNTSFDKFINQSIIAALNDEGESKGEIANYVITAVQNGVASNGKALNDHIVAYGIEGVTGLTDFVDKIYNEIFKEDGAIKKQLDGLDELLNAINAYVGSGQGQLADYQAVIDEIMATRNAVTALELPEGKTLSQAVQDIITAELADSKATLGKLQSDLKAEISALKGMIQSIVYVPESADRTVTLNNFMVNFTEWKPLATSDKMVVKFRVSPRTAIAELTKEDSKYLVATDKQKLTRSAIVPFEVESIAAVEGEGNENLIAVTLKGLSAADNKKGYAISLTVKDKDEATRLNDISSDYFAVVQNTLYIQNVEWSSVNANQTELNNVADATIDYKAEGSKLVIKTSTNENGDQGVKEDQTPEELYLDASLFDLSFEMSGDNATDNFVFTTDKDRAILSVKDPKPDRLGCECTVKSKVTITDPASASEPATVVFEKQYAEITIKSKDEYTAKDIAEVWHRDVQFYNLADIADIKTKLGLGETDNFEDYTVTMTTPADATDVDLIITGDNSAIQLKAMGGKVYNGAIVATLSSANTSLVITIPSVKIDYPKEEKYTLVNNTPGTWDGATALLNPNFVTTSAGIESVTATRSLTELFSNFTEIKEYITGLGGDVEFALKNSPIQGVNVNASTGVITVDKTYEGEKSIVALVTIKCGEKKLLEKNIPIAIPAEMNGTFAYATVEDEGETQGELAVTVTNPTTRKTAVVLKNALSWKDAKENVIWPVATSGIYAGDPMTLNGFSVSYAFKNKDAADNTKFELNSVAGTLTMNDDVANWTQYSIPMEIVVTATPKSPWGDMSSLAKDITVKVPAWRDIQ